MTLYDFAMGSLALVGSVGAVYYSWKIAKAAKEGKVRYIGKVRIGPTKLDKR